MYPTADGIDPRLRRRLMFLRTVLEDRLRVELREKLGAAYAPRVGNRSSLIFPGDGFIAVEVLSEPSRADAVADRCLDVAEALAREGVTPEEVDRLRPVLLARLRDRRRENQFWIDVLGSCHGRKGAPEEARSEMAHCLATRPEDLTPLATRFLGRGNASLLVVRPRGR